MGVMKAERHLFYDKRAPIGTLLSGRGDSNTRPLRPERSALANCATSRNSIIYLTKRGLRFRETPFVGMRRLERPTPTSLTWCANQLRHIPNRTAKIAIFSYHQNHQTFFTKYSNPFNTLHQSIGHLSFVSIRQHAVLQTIIQPTRRIGAGINAKIIQIQRHLSLVHFSNSLIYSPLLKAT